MFTVFINTQPKLNINRHAPLLDALRGAGKLLVLECTMRDLQGCAAQLADTISWDERYDEEYNLITYIEIEERNEEAIAKEHILQLQIEENLYTTLYELGRKPKNALILFGENFRRGREYSPGEGFEKRVRQAFWDMFPVPAPEKARELLKLTRTEYPELGEKEFEEVFIDALLRNQSGESPLVRNGRGDNGSIGRFTRNTLVELADTVRTADWQEVDFLDVLYIAVNNQREYGWKDMVGDESLCAYIRLLDSDVNAVSRSIWHVLLYVCLSAAQDKLRTQNNDDQVTLPAKETVPGIEWTEVCKALSQSAYVLENEQRCLEGRQESFPRFISPELNSSTLYGAKLPELPHNLRLRVGMRAGKLQAAANGMMAEIREKTLESDRAIRSFVTRLTDNFNNDKDRLMGGLSYKNEVEQIGNENLAESFIDRERSEADVRIIRKRQLSAAAADIEEVLKLAKKRIDYCFSCMYAKRSLAAALAVFMALFAGPYLAVSRDIWDTDTGWLYFAATVLLAGLAFALGSLFFSLHCRRRIIAELTALSNAFARIQKEKAVLMEEYEKLIRQDIPKSYCLALYEKEFRAFLDRRKADTTYMTYHRNALRHYSKFVNDSLSELGLQSMAGYSSVSARYESRLVLHKDLRQNDSVYCMVPEDRLEKCFIFREGAGA